MSGNASIRIAPAGRSDIADVDAIMTEAFDPRFGEAWTPSQCLGMLSLPGVWLSIAWDEDLPVGFTLTRATVDEAELLLIAVRPPARGQGVGRALLHTVVAEARGRGAVRLFLEMRGCNPAARLYEREGFAKIGERRAYYIGRGGVRFDAHSYVRDLSTDDPS